jgi:hypothetical protein
MVQRMANMHVAIGVWRAIMQDELFAPTGAIAQLRSFTSSSMISWL